VEGEVAHFITLSFWESQDAIAAFAGADASVAKYYPEDVQFLLELETRGHALRTVRVIWR
jgi:heme-degrading monooxygenase HmoA